MVPRDNDLVLMQRRGTAFAESVADLHFAQVLFPFEISLEIVAIQAARTKERVDILSIRDRGLRRKTALTDIETLVRHFFARDLLPEYFPGLPIEANQCELVDFSR